MGHWDLVEGFLQSARRGDYDLYARLYVCGDSLKKVGKETGGTTSAIKMHVHRARHRLMTYMHLHHERTIPSMHLEVTPGLAGWRIQPELTYSAFQLLVGCECHHAGCHRNVERVRHAEAWQLDYLVRGAHNSR